MALPKINLGINHKNAFFDKTHDVSTTSDFGFCQPTLVDEILKGTKVSLNTRTFVRLAPLPQPSFARVECRQYNSFVPMSEVFEAFDYMQANRSLNTSIRSYIPVNADNISVGNLLSFILGVANFEAFDNFSEQLFYPVFWGRFNGGISPYPSTSTNFPFEPVKSDFDFSAYQNDLKGLTYDKGVPIFRNTKFADEFCLPLSDFHTLLHNGSSVYYKESSYSHHYLSPSIENADFVSYFKSSSGLEFILTWHASKFGKKLLKVLRGLGIQFKFPNQKISLNSLYAFYKVWFDLFNPGRVTSWKQTSCYSLIHNFYDYGESIDILFNKTNQYQNREKISSLFSNFINELAYCNYSLKPDPLTICQSEPYSNGTDSQFDVLIEKNAVDSVYTQATPNAASPYTLDTPSSSITIKALQKLLPYVNKNTVIGSRVHEYMKVHFGYDYETNYQFGKNKFSLEISDVLSNADTSSGSDGALLGEYAGKSSGFGSSISKFTAPEQGFIIQLTVLVPFGGYSQATNNELSHINRLDFYQPFMDSVGYEAVPFSAIYGSAHVFGNVPVGTFGYRPRYFGEKYKNNLRNGDFARRGTMPQFMPYQLDRFFRERSLDVITTVVDNVPQYTVESITHYQAVVNEGLRFIGQSEGLGNYDRIFYDNQGVDDNFIIHIVQEYKLHSPMLPISDSFDTFDNEGLNDDNSTISKVSS